MTWREDLRRVTIDGRKLVGASFRGVPFFVESDARSGGRRTVVHEFPLRDDPFVEDLGKRGIKFKVSGYVLGDDYLVQRDALMAALEDTAGPGELVHLYYGTLRAICDSVEVTQTSAAGGRATFTIDFIATPLQAPVPVIATDASGKVTASAVAAKASTKAELGSRFNVARLPGFALASAASAIAKVANVLDALLAPLVTSTQELATLNGDLTLLVAQTSSLLTTPALIVDRLVDAIEALTDTATSAPGDLQAALIAAYSVDLGSPPAPTTTTREQEIANLAALTGALRQVIAIEAAQLAPSVPYTSLEDASAARDQVAAMLDEQADLAGDVAYPGLVTLRSDLMRAVPGGNNFPRVVTTTLRTAIPSLLLAYHLYGSVDLEADVLARNRVRNPGFVFGALQVLSNGA